MCGNEVKLTQVGGGTLVCCGEDMKLMGLFCYVEAKNFYLG
ncbi:MAG: hypothetical protein HF976_07685 [ANME-2 cluster archaeon]|nr:hypothetical protein [ANME-2 cluster archaeon]MBC2701279.1 hypothetical protein [ANME-2 cluster archaeon]MBC2708611.1 hypothetical protein [ANME-2 cluster archaeon]MBC2747895.1 hypothetical protein [ANME-2 cluster archaeon]MBC2763194.1 hypothetical protein [ANME-2 cluster archaeon]